MKYKGIPDSAFGFGPEGHGNILGLILLWAIQPLSSNDEPELIDVVAYTRSRLERYISSLMFFEIADMLSPRTPSLTPQQNPAKVQVP